MKHKIVFTLIPLLLLASCSNIPTSDSNGNNSSSIYEPSDTRTSDLPDSSLTDPSIDSSSGSTTTDPSTGTKTDKIEIKTLGDLYVNGYRSIYVILDNSLSSSEITWSSLNESIVKVSVSENNSLEAMLIAISEGTTTIRATTVDGLYYNDYEITVYGSSTGTIMSEELYSQISAGVQFDLKEYDLIYDSNLNSTIDDSYTITTIYEENQDAVSDLYYNLTDAYSFNGKNDKTNTSSSISYVRNSTDLAKEYININNEIKKESVYDEDGNRTKFDNSIFVNFLGDVDYFTNKDFVSFDNGKTYHYIGGYISSAYLATSLLYLSNISPDDVWFSVTDNKVTGFDFIIDPLTDDDKDTTKKYGMNVTGTVSNQKSAKIDHLKPFEHESYHDNIDTALTNTRNSHNYTIDYDVNFGSGVGTNHYTYKFDESTVDLVITSGSTTSHTGARKTDTGYYTYSYDDATKVVTVEKEYTSPFHDPENGINRYPTFDFASEIFDDINSNGIYETRGGNGKNGQILSYSTYLPSLYGTWNSQGELTIKDGYVSTISAGIDLVDSSTTITLNYTNFNSTNINIDFSNTQDKPQESSWEEASSYLYNSMVEYGIEDVVPYLYSSAGWSYGVAFSRTVQENGHENCYITTKAFDSDDLRDKYINDYKELLIQQGWTQTTTNDYNSDYASRILYSKTINDKLYEISVGTELNWNNKETSAVRINIYADGLNK